MVVRYWIISNVLGVLVSPSLVHSPPHTYLYVVSYIHVVSMSPKSYEEQKKVDIPVSAPCSTPLNSSPAIQKTFFSKPRHKNKVHKIPGQTE